MARRSQSKLQTTLEVPFLDKIFVNHFDWNFLEHMGLVEEDIYNMEDVL
jgi:hypothetical protein